MEDISFGGRHFYPKGVILSPNPEIIDGHLNSMADRYRDKSQGLGVKPLLDLNDGIIPGPSLICQEFYFDLLSIDGSLIVYYRRGI